MINFNFRHTLFVLFTCTISSFSLASENSDAQQALIMPIEQIEKEIAEAHKDFTQDMKGLKFIIEMSEISAIETADDIELDVWTKGELIPQLINKCDQHNIKLKRLKQIRLKKIELAEREASTRRLERILIRTQARGTARKLIFDNNN